MSSTRTFALLGAIATSCLALPSTILEQVELLEPARITEPSYVWSWGCTWANATVGGGSALDIAFGELWGQAGRKTTAAADWSRFDSIAFTVTNYENRPINLGIRIEGTLDRNDGSRIQSVPFIAEPLTTTTWVLDIKPDEAKAAGLHAMPPALSTAHRRLFFTRAMSYATVYNWHVYLRDSTPSRIRLTSPRLLRTDRNLLGIADPFFQWSSGTYPGKVSSQADLIARATAERQALAAQPGSPELTGSMSLKALKKTNRWGTHRTPSGKWYLVHPSGRLFWSLGIDTVRHGIGTVVTGREGRFASLPPNAGVTAEFYSQNAKNLTQTQVHPIAYNLFRKFGETWRSDWQAMAAQRLKSWGFNTIGHWSDNELLRATDIPYRIAANTNEFSTRLRTPYALWGSLPDPYAADFTSWTTSSMQGWLSGHKGRTPFMGIIVDCELSWSDGTEATRYQVATAALNAASSQPAKTAFLSQLQSKYSTISALNTAWGTSYVSWSSLQPSNVFNVANPTAACKADLGVFVKAFAGTYYSKVKTALSNAGNTALYLGSADLFPTPETMEAAEQHVDVVTLNVYRLSRDVDWTFPMVRSKPILISEFSFGANDRGSFYTGPVGVADQNERASRLVEYAERALLSPKVLGISWFEYYDQPVTGRTNDGENSNMGFVSITDDPFEELVAASRLVGSSIYSRRGP